MRTVFMEKTFEGEFPAALDVLEFDGMSPSSVMVCVCSSIENLVDLLMAILQENWAALQNEFDEYMIRNALEILRSPRCPELHAAIQTGNSRKIGEVVYQLLWTGRYLHGSRDVVCVSLAAIDNG